MGVCHSYFRIICKQSSQLLIVIMKTEHRFSYLLCWCERVVGDHEVHWGFAWVVSMSQRSSWNHKSVIVIVTAMIVLYKKQFCCFLCFLCWSAVLSLVVTARVIATRIDYATNSERGSVFEPSRIRPWLEQWPSLHTWGTSVPDHRILFSDEQAVALELKTHLSQSGYG